jgi:hypothetical protein
MSEFMPGKENSPETAISSAEAIASGRTGAAFSHQMQLEEMLHVRSK